MIWVCGCRIEFSDGGPPENHLIHEGTEQECDRVTEMLPAVVYAGGRPIKSVSAFVAPGDKVSCTVRNEIHFHKSPVLR